MNKPWTEGKVGDLLFGLEAGVSVNGKDRALSEGEQGVLKVSAVSYGCFNPKAVKAIKPEERSKAKVTPKAQQIIISRSNTEKFVGASAYIETNHPNLFLPDKLWQTVPKPSSNMLWLSYVLATEHIRFRLSRLATGTSGSMKNITKGELLGLKISIPPSKEQKKIAQILQTWDKAIKTTEQLLENSRLQKKALMQMLIRYKNNNQGKIKKLSEIVEIIYGKSSKGLAVTSGRYPILGSGGVNGKSNSYNESGPCIILGRKGSIDRPLYVTTPCWAIDTVFSITEKANIELKWLYYWLCSQNLRKYDESTGVPSLSRSTLSNIKVHIPAKEIQQKIAKILSTADKEIELLQKKVEYLKQEKKALMQQLLTGRKRVKVS